MYLEMYQVPSTDPFGQQLGKSDLEKYSMAETLTGGNKGTGKSSV